MKWSSLVSRFSLIVEGYHPGMNWLVTRYMYLSLRNEIEDCFPKLPRRIEVELGN